MTDAHLLKQKAINGFFWQLAQRMSSQVVSFVVSIVLARLLTPDEFGLVAMTSIFLSIASVFATSGLGTSLVQKKNVDVLDCDTVFYAGFVLSTIVYTILYFAAPYIAELYHQPLLVQIVRVQGIGLFLSCIGSVQNAIITRRLDFKQFFKVSLVSSAISGIIGLSMAFAGFGVWSLIIQSLLGTLANVIVLNRIVKWFPGLHFSFSRLKQLYAFGLNLTATTLLGTFFNELRGFLIGLRYSPADLAYVNRGTSIPSLIDKNIRGTISGILFPAMSRLQDDKDAVKAFMRRSMMTTTFLIAPAMVLLSAMSENLILLIYSSKWAMAVPFMQVVCFQYLFGILGEANLQAMNALGRSDMTLKLELIKKPVYLLIIIYTTTISPLAMVIGNTLYGLIGGAINAVPNKRLIKYSYREQLKDILPSVVLAVLTGAVVYLIGILEVHFIVQLVCQAVVGLGFYFFAAVFFRLESMEFLMRTVKELVGRE